MVTDIIATEAHGKSLLKHLFFRVFPWLLRKLAPGRSDSVFQVYNRAYAQVP